MSEWKQLITSGSDATLGDVTVNNLTIAAGGTFIDPNPSGYATASSTYYTGTTNSGDATLDEIGPTGTDTTSDIETGALQYFEGTIADGYGIQEYPGAGTHDSTNTGGISYDISGSSGIGYLWKRNNFVTPSSLTGPSTAGLSQNLPANFNSSAGDYYTQQDSSYFAFAEVSDTQDPSGTQNKPSIFCLPVAIHNLNQTNSATTDQIIFYFYSYGSGIGTLRIFASDEEADLVPSGTNTVQELYYNYLDSSGQTYTNDSYGAISSAVQGAGTWEFHKAIIPLDQISTGNTKYIYFHYNGATGYAGDMAIDSIGRRRLWSGNSNNHTKLEIDAGIFKFKTGNQNPAINNGVERLKIENEKTTLSNNLIVDGDNRGIYFDNETKIIGDHSIDGLQIRTTDDNFIVLKTHGNNSRLVVKNDHIHAKVPMRGLMPFIKTSFFQGTSASMTWLPWYYNGESTGTDPQADEWFVAPFDGRVVKLTCHFENAPGSTRWYLYKDAAGGASSGVYINSSEGSTLSDGYGEVIATVQYHDNNGNDTEADNYPLLNGTGNSFTKGATLGIRMAPTNSPGYTQIMAVFEFDTTT